MNKMGGAERHRSFCSRPWSLAGPPRTCRERRPPPVLSPRPESPHVGAKRTRSLSAAVHSHASTVLLLKGAVAHMRTSKDFAAWVDELHAAHVRGARRAGQPASLASCLLPLPASCLLSLVSARGAPCLWQPPHAAARRRGGALRARAPPEGRAAFF